MTQTLDSQTSCSTKTQSFQKSNLKRNVAIGAGAGILCVNFALAKGRIKNIPKINYDIPAVMALCTGSSLGGYEGANVTTKENKKGRKVELRNQLIFDDLVPLLIMGVVDKCLTIKNKLARSLVLAGSLLLSTLGSHKVSEKVMKKEGLKPNYPVKTSHLIADADDYLLPIVIATKSKPLQNILKLSSLFTYLPTGINVGMAKDIDYYA